MYTSQIKLITSLSEFTGQQVLSWRRFIFGSLDHLNHEIQKISPNIIQPKKKTSHKKIKCKIKNHFCTRFRFSRIFLRRYFLERAVSWFSNPKVEFFFGYILDTKQKCQIFKWVDVHLVSRCSPAT